MFPLMSPRSKRTTPSRLGSYDSVAVRMARPEDDAAIHRIAALDGKRVPGGRVLVAEADAEVIAAMPAAGGTVVADPFRWTSEVVALMELRAAQFADTGRAPLAAPEGAVQALRTQPT